MIVTLIILVLVCSIVSKYRYLIYHKNTLPLQGVSPKNTKYHTLTLSIKPNAKPLKLFQKKVNGKLVINGSQITKTPCKGRVFL
jgi:hypothetical protein